MTFTPWNPNPKAIDRVTDKFPIPTECPHCKSAVEIRSNSAIYNGVEYGDWPYIYLCMNTKCWASIGMHPQTNLPLGTLAHGPLRQARMKAKNEFNPIWQNGEMARSYAYHWLAKQMKLSTEECHFGLFNEKQCEQAIQIIRNRHKTPKAEQPSWKQKLVAAVTGGKIDTTPKFKSFKNVKSLGEKK